jgi:hypothetical protein
VIDDLIKKKFILVPHQYLRRNVGKAGHHNKATIIPSYFGKRKSVNPSKAFKIMVISGLLDGNHEDKKLREAVGPSNLCRSPETLRETHIFRR